MIHHACQREMLRRPLRLGNKGAWADGVSPGARASDAKYGAR
jgi:hypothetical protein